MIESPKICQLVKNDRRNKFFSRFSHAFLIKYQYKLSIYRHFINIDTYSEKINNDKILIRIFKDNNIDKNIDKKLPPMADNDGKSETMTHSLTH